MSILVINSGSTSLKYKLFDENEKEIKRGNFNGIKNTEKAVKAVLREISDLRGIKAVGHRVVHGGDKFIKPALVNEKILKELEEFNDLAPLHNPYNIAGIKAARNFLPDIPQIAVFDTAFFADLPKVARTYALPVQIIQKYKIKRYGFHGISHEFVMQEAAQYLTPNPPHQVRGRLSSRTGEGGKGGFYKGFNLITCHLGGGWSVTAVKNGKPADTSMGWTPMEGLVMMTRAGDLDPGIVVELFKESSGYLDDEKLEDVYNILNHESGLKGLSGGSANYQDLLKEMSFGNEDAKLAFDVAIYRLTKYIGAYWSVLQGDVDAIVFTGAIGAGNPITRNAVMAKLKFLRDIKVLAIKTNEELMIAREVGRVISKTSNKT